MRYVPKRNIADVRFARDGKLFTKMFRLTHPNRQQRFMIVNTPRACLPQFLEDWCYQPYCKTNQVRISTELLPQWFTLGVRVPVVRKKTSDILTCFQFTQMPDPMQINPPMSRMEWVRRNGNIYTAGVLSCALGSVYRRDMGNHAKAYRKIRKLAGLHYLGHPHEDEKSWVLLLTQCEVPAALDALESLGFEIEDTVEVYYGEEADISLMYWWGNTVATVFLCQWWLIIALNVFGLSYYVYLEAMEFKKKLEKEAEMQKEGVRLSESSSKAA